MKKFNTHIGLAVILDRANIDTDQIIPKQFLCKVDRHGFGIHLFHDWRYKDDAGTQFNSKFNLNYARYKGASILLTKENFGCGSSREHAPWALMDFGFRVIIAPSFADIFYANSINNGLLVVRLKASAVQQLMDEVTLQEGANIKVDLQALEVTSTSGAIFSFTLSASDRNDLLKGLDAIAVTLTDLDAILRYEAHIPCWRK